MSGKPEKYQKSKIAGGFAGILLFAAGVIASFEGKENKAYLDPVNIPTICYGHTDGVELYHSATDLECETMLAKDISTANGALDRHVRVPLTSTQRAAFVSFVFNVGEGRFARSTLLRKLNGGDVVGACNELTKWVYAGGRKLPGLVRRREKERELCLAP